jgi:hypothetical protein
MSFAFVLLSQQAFPDTKAYAPVDWMDVELVCRARRENCAVLYDEKWMEFEDLTRKG